MTYPERFYLTEKISSEYVEYVRGDIVESIRQRRRETEAEIERLRAIVDLLPKDAKGNPIVPGMDVWSNTNGRLWRWRVRSIRASGNIEVDNGQGSVFWRLPQEFHSGKKAAEAAK